MFFLSWGKYMLLDGIIYMPRGRSPENPDHIRLLAVDPAAEPRRREIPAKDYRPVGVSPTATIRGHRAEALILNDDGTVSFGLAKVPPGWPADLPLERYGMPERAGDGFWTGTVPASEVSDLDDDIPEDWRPFLPPDHAR